MAKRKTKKPQRRRISKDLTERFGFPSARKFKLPKNRRGTGKLGAVAGGQQLLNGGDSYIAVLTQADLIGPTEVSYYRKRVGDIARRWLEKGNDRRVSVELVTLFAKESLDVDSGDDVVIGPRYMTPSDDEIPDVGDDWEYRQMYRTSALGSIVGARNLTSALLTRAAARTGMQDNDLDFLGTFIIAIRVRKWTRS